MIAKRLLALLIVCLIIGSISAQVTSYDKLSDRLLLEMDKSDKVPTIILLADQLLLDGQVSVSGKVAKGSYVYNQLYRQAQLSQAEIKRLLADDFGLTYRSFTLVNAIAVVLTVEQIEQIAALPSVAQVLYDGAVVLEVPEESQQLIARVDTAEYGISAINADSLWSMGIRGAGVVVAGQDTGYEWELPQIVEQYRGYDDVTGTADHNYNWHDAIHQPVPVTADSLNPCGYSVMEPCDDNNHGTHTMGTMVGTDASTAPFGVAPEAQWMACRNMDRGNGAPSTYIECFDWFLAPRDLTGGSPRPDLAPHVIANSWACPPSEGCNPDNFEVMRIAVNNLRAAGIVVVVSAGNSGPNCYTVSSPAAIFEGSFTVGAVDVRDSIAGFSSRGLVLVDSSLQIKPNVVAPGVAVKSMVRDGSYRYWNGTSMAGPHVAGAVALLLSAVPQLAGEVELIESILQDTALPLISGQECSTDSLAYPNPTYGYGRIDVLAAVRLAQSIVSSTDDQETSAEVVAYPNPASQLIWLKGDLPVTIDLEMIDLMGRTCITQTTMDSQAPISVDGLAPGLYLLKIKNIDQPVSVIVAR